MRFGLALELLSIVYVECLSEVLATWQNVNFFSDVFENCFGVKIAVHLSSLHLYMTR